MLIKNSVTKIKQIIREKIYSYYQPYLHQSNIDEVNLSSIRRKLKEDGYFSQYGQDKWLVENFFKNNQMGFFVDIGAHDGISFSNTYYLEKLGWDGVAIEPNPEVFSLLERNRNCNIFNCAICGKPGVQKFRVISGYSQMLSGLLKKYDNHHQERISKEINLHGGKYSDIDIECNTLSGILQKIGKNYIDYLSIDVEGAEYEILTSIDFQKINIKLISVENNYRDYRIPKLLKRMGFIFYTIIGDEFYLNHEYLLGELPSEF